MSFMCREMFLLDLKAWQEGHRTITPFLGFGVLQVATCLRSVKMLQFSQNAHMRACSDIFLLLENKRPQ